MGGKSCSVFCFLRRGRLGRGRLCGWESEVSRVPRASAQRGRIKERGRACRGRERTGEHDCKQCHGVWSSVRTRRKAEGSRVSRERGLKSKRTALIQKHETQLVHPKSNLHFFPSHLESFPVFHPKTPSSAPSEISLTQIAKRNAPPLLLKLLPKL